MTRSELEAEVAKFNEVMRVEGRPTVGVEDADLGPPLGKVALVMAYRKSTLRWFGMPSDNTVTVSELRDELKRLAAWLA